MRFLVLLLGLALFSLPAASSASTAAARAELDRRGIDYTEWAFVDSAAAGNLAVVKLFVQSGMSVESKGSGSATPLYGAAGSGNLDLVKYLVGQGADVNAKDFNGFTALHAAARSGKLEVVEYLVEEQGLDVNATDNLGGTVLHPAALGGSVAVVEYLVGLGLDVAMTRDDWTALHSAAGRGHLEVVRYLVEEQGLDVNAENRYDNTALHRAAERGYLEVVRYLVGQGADVTARDNNGRTPRGRAAGMGETDVAAYLASVGEREKLISIPSSGVGKWEVDQELDPVNDKQNVFAVLPSEDFVRGRSGALLGITCDGGEVFEVQILPQGVKVAYESDASSDVIWRFDKLKAVSKKWVVSKDRETLYPMSKYSRKLAEVRVQQIRWAQNLLVRSQLFVRIKDSEGKRGAGDFVFDLRGSAKAVDLVLGACGW